MVILALSAGGRDRVWSGSMSRAAEALVPRPVVAARASWRWSIHRHLFFPRTAQAQYVVRHIAGGGFLEDGVWLALTERSLRENPAFVSYARADRAWAEWIAWVLEEAGFTTVLQAWDFAAGENFLAAMQRASAEARRTIAVLSPDYALSRWGEWEWTAALDRQRLLPVRVRDFEPAGLLKLVIYDDLVGVDEQAAREQLLAEVKRAGGRAKPSVEPQFPGGESAHAVAPRFPGALPEAPTPTLPLPASKARREAEQQAHRTGCREAEETAEGAAGGGVTNRGNIRRSRRKGNKRVLLAS